jgi:N-hydroxyarylamine O-acetyltransferase
MDQPDTNRPDLAAYFKRIGYSDSPRAPTLETLRALHLHHAQAITFENLSPFSGQPVKLDLPSLERKLVHEGRGGYCFEQNLLFSHVLGELGFSVRGLAARVVWNAPEGAIRKRSHMVLLIELGNERYIADVGFGGLTLTAPLRLVTDIEQPTPHETFRLIDEDGDFVLQAQIRTLWKPVYRFDLQRQHLVDYEVSSWYLSNHPESRFVTHLIAARPVPGRRYALLNDTFTVHESAGGSEQRRLGSVAEMREVLREQFGLRLPADDRAIEAALARVFAHS